MLMNAEAHSSLEGTVISASNGNYNAVTYLLDRNVAAGRGDKVVFRDPVADITYVALQT